MEVHDHLDSRPDHRRRGETFAEVAERHLSRRDVVRGGIVLAAAALVPDWVLRLSDAPDAGAVVPALAMPASATPSRLCFDPVHGDAADRVRVATGHHLAVLLRWGDPILPGAPAFDLHAQTAAAQAGQFGYNCDYVGFFPLPRGKVVSDRGLLVVNHEFTIPELMIPGFNKPDLTQAQMEIQLAAHGLSVVEIKRDAGGRWGMVAESRYNRRITGRTICEIAGPAARHKWMRTSVDKIGTRVAGTLGNCSAGKTPWGTVLSGEENFTAYFGQAGFVPWDPLDTRKRNHVRYLVPGKDSDYRFEYHDQRFNLNFEPNEPFRFGWVVEVDPYDPSWVPRKRTALGRFKHEAATTTVAKGGQLVVYMGDDERFEYVYKFVSERAYAANDRGTNRDLMDRGKLFVARFNSDGTGAWLPLVYGTGGLVGANGFDSQATILINTRLAADFLGATQMDRPEDIEVDPVRGKVYIVLTNNIDRGTTAKPLADAPNPRVRNKTGHIVELEEDGGDHAATRFAWRIFLLCGDPDDPTTYFGGFPKDQVSPIACPDNLTFDRDGHLWIATDGQGTTLGINDGLFAVPVEGSERGYVRQFFSAVPGAEVCGPEFTPDNTTLFLAIQHPGEGSLLSDPKSRWPDGDFPRPSVVAVSADGGGQVGRAGEVTVSSVPTSRIPAPTPVDELYLPKVEKTHLACDEAPVALDVNQTAGAGESTASQDGMDEASLGSATRRSARRGRR